MPVVVAHASGPVGHGIVTGLLTLDADAVRAEVWATVEHVAERRWFLDRGVPVAVAELDDPDLLTAIVTGAHTLVLIDERASTDAAAGASAGAGAGAGGDAGTTAQDLAAELEVVRTAVLATGVLRVIGVGTFAAALAALTPPLAGTETLLVPRSALVADTVAHVLALDARG